MKDKVCVITGSTSGIGRGIADHFAQLGARVVVHGRNVERGEAAVKAIKDAGGDAFFVAADLKDEASCRALIAKAVERYGQHRRARQQRGRHVARHDRVDEDGAVRRDHQPEPARAVHPDAGSRHPHEAAPRRLHRQHRLRQRLHRRTQAVRVFGVERRADDADEEHGVIPESVPNPRQSNQRRLDADRGRAEGQNRR